MISKAVHRKRLQPVFHLDNFNIGTDAPPSKGGTENKGQGQELVLPNQVPEADNAETVVVVSNVVNVFGSRSFNTKTKNPQILNWAAILLTILAFVGIVTPTVLTKYFNFFGGEIFAKILRYFTLFLAPSFIFPGLVFVSKPKALTNLVSQIM